MCKTGLKHNIKEYYSRNLKEISVQNPLIITEQQK